jgi:hypothetical protein
VTPNTNLIKNIGFGEGATHATSGSNDSQYANLPIGEIREIVHPKFIISDMGADIFFTKKHSYVSFFQPFKDLVKNIIPPKYLPFVERVYKSIKVLPKAR